MRALTVSAFYPFTVAANVRGVLFALLLGALSWLCILLLLALVFCR